MRKFSKKYKKMMKHYHKELSVIYKQASKSPWEWSWSIDYLVKCLEFMRDYYRLGENVMSMENNKWNPDCKDAPTREQCLNMILAEYHEWQNCEDKFFHVHDNSKNTYTCPREKYSQENIKAFNTEYQFHRGRFFELLSTYIESLWD